MQSPRDPLLAFQFYHYQRYQQFQQRLGMKVGCQKSWVLAHWCLKGLGQNLSLQMLHLQHHKQQHEGTTKEVRSLSSCMRLK